MRKVFVSGCYDIIHGGHIEFFRQAKSYGDYLIVNIASDEVLLKYKNKKSSLPIKHKIDILNSISIVDEVMVSSNLASDLDFEDNFLSAKPWCLVVTQDDKFEKQKRDLCKRAGSTYIKVPKTLGYDQISTSEILNKIKAPDQVPLRVDFGGGWLDVPRFSRPGSYICNCAVNLFVSLEKWNVPKCSGLGGSAAYALLMGKDAVKSELKMNVGWQDPAVIRETGLCAWKSGDYPDLAIKRSGDILKGKMALYWTGSNHNTPLVADKRRKYDLIEQAGNIGYYGIVHNSYEDICRAVDISYYVQIDEGMRGLPRCGEISKKYCGGGFGGYALYMFRREEDIPKNLVKINPFIDWQL